MRVGVNYTPRRGWFHSWLDFDANDVRRDFEAIAALGLDHVRVFPLWPLLQPNRTLIRPQAIADVVAVADAAAEQGLSVSVDVLNGHLSSFDFLPSWLVTWHRRNLFTDPLAISGERALIGELAAALHDHPAATGLTLGNEFAQFAAPVEPHRHPAFCPAVPTEIDSWLGEMFSAVREGWPGGVHTHGFDDDVFFVDEHPFTPRHAVTYGDVTTVHAWVFTSGLALAGRPVRDLALFPRYLVDLAAAWGGPDRRIWLQEVGAPRTLISDADAPAFMSGVLDAIVDVPELDAVTWWCSHDVNRDLADFPEVEYALGLFDADGRPKPEARLLAERIPELRAATGRSRDGATLTFNADWTTGAGRSATSPAGELFERWLAEAGARPRITRLN